MVTCGTHGDDAGVVGQEVARRDVASLVFCAADVQRELHGALGAEVFTRAVLQRTHKKHKLTVHPASNNTDKMSFT